MVLNSPFPKVPGKPARGTKSLLGFAAPLHRLDDARRAAEVAARTRGDSQRASLEAGFDFQLDAAAAAEAERAANPGVLHLMSPVQQDAEINRRITGNTHRDAAAAAAAWDFLADRDAQLAAAKAAPPVPKPKPAVPRQAAVPPVPKSKPPVPPGAFASVDPSDPLDAAMEVQRNFIPHQEEAFDKPFSFRGLQQSLKPHFEANSKAVTPDNVRQILRDGGIEANALRIFEVQTGKGPKKAMSGDIQTIPPATLSPDLTAARTKGTLPAAWRDRIGRKETANLKDPWGAIHVDRTGVAYGRYQMRNGALKDTGMMRPDGTWTGKYGVNNERDFLDNHEAQNAVLEDYNNIRLKPDSRGLEVGNAGGRKLVIDDLVGRRLNGIDRKARPDGFTITESGVIAAMHRAGAGNVQKYFRKFYKPTPDGAAVTTRGKERQMTKFDRWIETRLREFADEPLAIPGPSLDWP